MTSKLNRLRGILYALSIVFTLFFEKLQTYSPLDVIVYLGIILSVGYIIYLDGKKILEPETDKETTKTLLSEISFHQGLILITSSDYLGGLNNIAIIFLDILALAHLTFIPGLLNKKFGFFTTLFAIFVVLGSIIRIYKLYFG